MVLPLIPIVGFLIGANDGILLDFVSISSFDVTCNCKYSILSGQTTSCAVTLAVASTASNNVIKCFIILSFCFYPVQSNGFFIARASFLPVESSPKVHHEKTAVCEEVHKPQSVKAQESDYKLFMYASKSFDEPSRPVNFVKSLLRTLAMLDFELFIKMQISDGVNPVLISMHTWYSYSLTMFSILLNRSSPTKSSFSRLTSSFVMGVKSCLA